MSHFTEGALQAYLDREVAADARAQIAAHVSDCADCAACLQELADSSALFASAVASVDERPLPMAALAELRMRARQETLQRPRQSPLRASWPLARAALLVLGLSAVAAAAVPGSPVRGWIEEVWSSLTAPEPQAAAPTQPVGPTPKPEPARGGMRVVPTDGRVRIVLEDLDAATQIRVVMVDSDLAWVKSSGGAAAGRFRRISGGLVLSGSGADEIEISMPRSLTSGTVEINGRIYVTTEADQWKYHGRFPADTSTESELTFTPAR